MSRDVASHYLRRCARDALFAFRAWTAHVRSPWFWRLLYGLLDREATVRLTAFACRQTAARFDITSQDAAERLAHLFLTGWPHHRGTPWVNLHVARFVWRVKRSLAGSHSQRQCPLTATSVRRLGLLANLSSTLTFSPSFFEQAPADLQLYAFDLGGQHRTAGYLERVLGGYEAFDARDTSAIAAAIEREQLDVLLFDVYKADLDGILDRVTVPCIIDVCTTVNLRFHPNVSFHLYCLEQADYVLREHRLFSATSGSDLDVPNIYPGALLFDRRNLDPSRRRSWREREPLIVYHGKLYKLSDSYLDTVLRLLQDDRDLQLVLMGRDDGHADRIRTAARRLDVAAQIHYEGEFRISRNEAGEVDDPSWLHLSGLLSRARLAPDPWPLAGAYSRLEAYAAGAPVVHMGIKLDKPSWRQPQLSVTADHPALVIEAATAYTVEEYSDLARRALYDEVFAESITDEQARRAVDLTSGKRFWNEIVACCRDWAGQDLTFGTDDEPAGRNEALARPGATHPRA